MRYNGVRSGENGREGGITKQMVALTQIDTDDFKKIQKNSKHDFSTKHHPPYVLSP